MNILSFPDQEQCEGKIKVLITNKNLTINPKGQKPYKINSYHRFIFTTNKQMKIIIYLPRLKQFIFMYFMI